MKISYFHTSEAVPPVLPTAEGGPDAAVVIDVRVNKHGVVELRRLYLRKQIPA